MYTYIYIYIHTYTILYYTILYYTILYYSSTSAHALVSPDKAPPISLTRPAPPVQPPVQLP